MTWALPSLLGPVSLDGDSPEGEQGVFERILLAIDGSVPAERAEAAAAKLAAKLGSEVLVVHVLRVYYSGAAIWSSEMSAEEAQALVDRVVHEVKGQGVRARGQVRETTHGNVAKEILDVAQDEDAGLIVIGSSGLSRIQGLVLGSTAYKVLHLAARPVLTVP